MTFDDRGRWTASFDRLEYWDSVQRWWIEFRPDSVRTYHVAGVSSWRGTREEWKKRMATLEEAFVRQYLEAVTTQQRRNEPLRLGPNLGAEEDYLRHLSVTNCLEEQLVVLLLARVDGVPRQAPLSTGEFPAFPQRVVGAANAVLERIRAQTEGTIAPEGTRDLSVKDQPWTPGLMGVPGFDWRPESALSPMQARALGRPLAGASSPEAVAATIRGNLARLAQLGRAVPPGVNTALVPVFMDRGEGTYDFKERLRKSRGAVTSSAVESQGRLKEARVAFFHSGRGRWVVAPMTVDTWYVGKVTRKRRR